MDKMTRRRLAVSVLFVTISLISWAGAGALAWFSYDVTMRLPGEEALRDLGDLARSTTIFDAKDRPVFTIFKEQRIEIPLEEMSPNLLKAVLSVEDQRFYEHGGIDMIRVAAALVNNVREGRRAEGGSTITQQLARQSFLTRDKTLRRKLKEVILAARLERAYAKKDILAIYLNKVYFGDGLYGVEAAARGFFGKPASELGIAEAALVAGIIQSPSVYAPTINLERAIARRNVVLQSMLHSGAIDRAEYDEAKASKVALENSLQRDESFGLYFKEQVRQALVQQFGWARVYQGGLQVYTTLDSELQEAAEKIFEDGLSEIERLRAYGYSTRAEVVKAAASGTPLEGAAGEYLQGALIAIDPATGHVPVMIGGRGFARSNFNRATQARRQPGSAFKPFVFAAALESGYSPASVISNLHDPILTQEGEWVPEDEHSGASSMTLRTALRISSNRAAVQLLREVGIPRTVGYAEKLALGTPPSVPSLALGSGVVTLDALTAAFGAFANGGFVRKPVMVRRVEDGTGETLFEAEDKPQRAVTEATAFLLANMLADVINAGTAHRARREGFTLPAAGKTGTTNDYLDAWFVGFTPSLVTGVWVGFDQPRTIVRDGYGGELAVPLWARFMKVATRGAKAEWLERPKNVIGVNICRMSGRLPNEGCSSVDVEGRDGEITTRSQIYTEYFVRGTQPGGICPLHPAPSTLDRIAGAFGIEIRRSAEPGEPGSAVDPSPSAPRPTATAGSEAPGDPEVEEGETKKKRGFWSRLFGRGDDKKDENDGQNKDKNKENKKDENKKPPNKPRPNRDQ